MTEIFIDGVIVERLRQIASQESRPIDAVPGSMLESYSTLLQPSDWPLAMARMAESDTDVPWNDYASDLSERSREILENEFGDYLAKRLSDNGDDSA